MGVVYAHKKVARSHSSGAGIVPDDSTAQADPSRQQTPQVRASANWTTFFTEVSRLAASLEMEPQVTDQHEASDTSNQEGEIE